MASQAPRLTRITPGQRLALQIVSVLLIVVGVVLFLSFFFALLGTMPGVGDTASFDEQGSAMAKAAARAVIGIVLLSLGSFIAKFAFLKPVSEIVATETASAVEHASGAVGRGFASSGFKQGESREVVKVRCRACGYLDTEDARFCSGCGKAM